MNILDYIILAVFAVSLVIGILKGFLKQIFSIAGFFVVILCTSLLAPYVQNWFVNVIENENTRMIIGMIASAVLLIVATALVSLMLRKILTRSRTVGIIDRVLGGLASVFVAYLAVSLVVELILHTGENFLPTLKGAFQGSFEESRIVGSLYKNNFFGRWIVNGIAQGILDSLQPGGNALAVAVCSIE